MAPKKKEQQQKMSLGAFLQDDNYGGSWADEVEEVVGSQPLPPASHGRSGASGYSSYGGGYERTERSYPSRDSFPTELPTKPPYTAHLGNLSYDATTEAVTEFLDGCDVTSVRIIEDRIEQRPKGFAYAEFKDVEGLKQALTLDGSSFQGRSIRIKIADPPKDRGDRGFGEGSARDLSSWDRKGPLPDIPGRNDRRDFSERRGPPRDGPVDDGKVRDFGNWERRGPLSPLPQAEREGSRDGSRPRTNDGKRGESFRGERRASPATWGEGRDEGSRPPRGEFRERPERPERPERTPTAADLDNQWRSNMKPDRQTPEQSRNPSEAPSPAGPAAAAPAGRPRLNLQKRTVSEAPGITSPPPTSAADSKANPFGAARPIDTAAKEREIAEKQEQSAKEKKEAEEKAKEERRLAKEAAAKEAADNAAAEAEAEKEKENAPAAETTESTEAAQEAESGTAGEQKIPTRPKEQVQNPKPRATESGNWRSASGEGRSARGGYQNAPRGGRSDSRGGRGDRGDRGDRGGRGGRFEGGRPPRSNGNPSTASATAAAPATAAAQPSATPASPPTPAAEAPADPEGWTTVPAKGRRNQSTRA
ncbi:RNA recognition domain-containing protein [Seiridium cupressi]